MPANSTPNYQLNQWERSDKVLMDDFNHDNAKIDSALAAKADASAVEALDRAVGGKAERSALDALSQTVSAQGATLANHTSTIAGLGNCMIVCRTYSGTGGTCMHDFDHRVLAIFAFGTYSHFSAIRGSSHGAGWAGQTFCDGAVRWSEKSVSWSGTSTAAGLCNESGKLYSLIALLDASK